MDGFCGVVFAAEHVVAELAGEEFEEVGFVDAGPVVWEFSEWLGHWRTGVEADDA